MTVYFPLAVAKPADDRIENALSSYLAQESDICGQIDPRIIQLAGSLSFRSNGFPYACLTQHNLGYYLDSQQENRAVWYMDSIGKLDAPTTEILKDALRILQQANAQTAGVGGGVSGLVHGLYCALNAVKVLPKPSAQSPVYTLEIGPGSGWTTYFLTRFGYHTATIDSSPNLIIVQRYLMEQLPKECSGHYQQILWWDFYDITQSAPHKFNMIIANHMICEILQWSRLYIAKWATLNLIENGSLYFQAWGDETFHSRYETLLDFKQHGIEQYARNDDQRFPEIALLKKIQEQVAPLSRAFTAQRKLLRIFPKLPKFLPTKHLEYFENYQLQSGVSVHETVRAMGFNEGSFTNSTFLYSGICT
jgi:hypothetical protein